MRRMLRFVLYVYHISMLQLNPSLCAAIYADKREKERWLCANMTMKHFFCFFFFFVSGFPQLTNLPADSGYTKIYGFTVSASSSPSLTERRHLSTRQPVFDEAPLHKNRYGQLLNLRELNNSHWPASQPGSTDGAFLYAIALVQSKDTISLGSGLRPRLHEQIKLTLFAQIRPKFLHTDR